TTLQLVPLPHIVIQKLSPAAARILKVAIQPLGLYPARRPLSLDPASTARELAKGLTCICVGLTATFAARRRRGRDALVAALPIWGTAVLSLGLCHALATGATLFEPKLPFINPNHLAGILNLAAWPALGLAMQARGNQRALWIVCFTLTSV